MEIIKLKTGTFSEMVSRLKRVSCMENQQAAYTKKLSLELVKFATDWELKLVKQPVRKGQTALTILVRGNKKYKVVDMMSNIVSKATALCGFKPVERRE